MSARKITDSSTDISEADYLAGEQRANIRHEYVDGKVYAMAGTSLRHNDIAMNIAFALRLAARGTPCRVNVSDVKVRAEKPKAYYYPDVMLGCDRDESSKHYLEKPCVIVEVTSPFHRMERPPPKNRGVSKNRLPASVFNRRARPHPSHRVLPRCRRRVGCCTLRPSRTNHSHALCG